LLEAKNTCTIEKVSFLIGFEDSRRVERSEMMREGIPKKRAACRKPEEARAMLIRGWERSSHSYGTRRVANRDGYSGRHVCITAAPSEAAAHYVVANCKAGDTQDDFYWQCVMPNRPTLVSADFSWPNKTCSILVG